MIKDKASTSVFRGDKFGNDALELAMGAGLEECGSVSGELFTEQEGMISRDKISQLGPSLKQRLVTEILPIEMQKVEGAEDQALRTRSKWLI
jgi:hypothetical protein